MKPVVIDQTISVCRIGSIDSKARNREWGQSCLNETQLQKLEPGNYWKCAIGSLGGVDMGAATTTCMAHFNRSLSREVHTELKLHAANHNKQTICGY